MIDHWKKKLKWSKLNHFNYFYWALTLYLMLGWRWGPEISRIWVLPLSCLSSSLRCRQVCEKWNETESSCIIIMWQVFHKDICSVLWNNREKTLWQWWELRLEVALGWEKREEDISGREKNQMWKRNHKKGKRCKSPAHFNYWSHHICFGRHFMTLVFFLKKLKLLYNSCLIRSCVMWRECFWNNFIQAVFLKAPSTSDCRAESWCAHI